MKTLLVLISALTFGCARLHAWPAVLFNPTNGVVMLPTNFVAANLSSGPVTNNFSGTATNLTGNATNQVQALINASVPTNINNAVGTNVNLSGIFSGSFSGNVQGTFNGPAYSALTNANDNLPILTRAQQNSTYAPITVTNLTAAQIALVNGAQSAGQVAVASVTTATNDASQVPITLNTTNAIYIAGVINFAYTSNRVNYVGINTNTSSSGGVTTNSINIQNFDANNFSTGFDFSPNQIIVVGFGRAADNGIYTYNPNLNYIDYNATPAVGGYTNLTGSYFLPTPGNPTWYLFTNTDLSNGADYAGLLNTNINYVQTGDQWSIDTFGTGSIGTVNWYDLNPKPHIKTDGNFIGSVTATNGTVIRHPLVNPYPMFTFNFWDNDCSSGTSVMSETALTNAVNFCKLIGLEPYIDGWMVDATWNSGSLVTNGVTYAREDTNVWQNLGGVAGAARWVHTNTTSKIWWGWIGISDLENSSSPNLFDITNDIVKYNFDGVSMDTTTYPPDPVTGNGNYRTLQRDGESELEAIRRMAWANNRNIQIRWNGNGFLMRTAPGSGGAESDWAAQRMIVDADGGEIGFAEANKDYTTFIQTVDNAVDKIASFPPGSYPQIPELQAIPTDTIFATNAWQAYALMVRCVVPFNAFIDKTNGIAGIMPWITNADVEMCAHDSQLSKGWQVSTNGFSRVWARSLSGNRSVIVFLNASTNSAYSSTITVNLRDLGYSPAQQVQARRIFFNTNYYTTGTISCSSIDTNCAVGFLLSPVDSGNTIANTIAANAPFTGAVLGWNGTNAIWETNTTIHF